MLNAQHLVLGREGEDMAARFVKERGYKILARNWRSAAAGLKALELDIVCREGGDVVFVEVKTRVVSGQNQPLHGFTRAKCQRLIRAGQAWLAENEQWDKPCRFDLVCVGVRDGKFYPELMRNVIQRDFMAGGNTAWQPW